MSLPKPPPIPCGTCPYRKDTPSGIWAAEEYAKLPQYDGDVPDQLFNGGHALFFCHQRDQCLCGGWLVTHDPRHLLALRMNPVDPSAYEYDPGVECWESGAAAALHGIQDIENPSPAAAKRIKGLLKKLGSEIT